MLRKAALGHRRFVVISLLPVFFLPTSARAHGRAAEDPLLVIIGFYFIKGKD
ncbi:hypothetical protein SLEP1_g52997 [Rubroshorea leprosula]|uniref:Uncharacterized protein n=1 Tax=Rubroshorea leprosula TaxID=152421 RepID=A0AAV5MBV3_9ROSI|nr:hypothetical protein SLEP1_g52997 [Rubroshorea leprosula]